MYNITRNMNELEEKCLRFVLRHYQKNKLDTRQALKVFKEKHGVVGKAGGKNRYFLFLSGLAAAMNATCRESSTMPITSTISSTPATSFSPPSASASPSFTSRASTPW